MRGERPDIARLYHLHSSNVRSRLPDMDVDHDRRPLRFRTYPGAPRVALPGRDFALTAPLGAVLEARRSVRAFAPRPLELALVGRLLHASYGLRRPAALVGEQAPERSSPSAGGLYPLELYLATRAVTDLADGIYHYDPRAHALELRCAGSAHEQLAAMTIGQEQLGQANLVVVVSALFERTLWKYGQRGYRYVWLDAGHLGQNLYLTATALGLGVVAVGGFYDDEVGRLLALPPDEAAIYLFAIGNVAASGERPPGGAAAPG